MSKSVLILGSTGSIGQTTLSLCKNIYRVKGLVFGKNIDIALHQIKTFQPEFVATSDYNTYQQLIKKLLPTTIFYGDEGISEVISKGYDIGVTAIPGLAGVQPTIEALQFCKKIAFANKETIIYLGDKLLQYAKDTTVIPIDSEHNAIFQILQSRYKKMILTASGGPLWNKSLDEIKNISIAEVLNHPKWKMGPKITVDSASMMNKAMELIEASYLFNCSLDKIDFLVHPEAIIHGMLELYNGNVISCMAKNDMSISIGGALAFPDENYVDQDLTLNLYNTMTFYQPNHEKFPIVNLVINAAKTSHDHLIAVNRANELAVDAFLNKKIKFHNIYDILSIVMDKTIPNLDIQDIIKTTDDITINAIIKYII
jgi:1-deoxy-D-xylulose-5-phosphate reductoisomerase